MTNRTKLPKSAPEELMDELHRKIDAPLSAIGGSLSAGSLEQMGSAAVYVVTMGYLNCFYGIYDTIRRRIKNNPDLRSAVDLWEKEGALKELESRYQSLTALRNRATHSDGYEIASTLEWEDNDWFDTQFPVKRYAIKSDSTSGLSDFISALQDGFNWWLDQEKLLREHSGYPAKVDTTPDIWDELSDGLHY